LGIGKAQQTKMWIGSVDREEGEDKPVNNSWCLDPTK